MKPYPTKASWRDKRIVNDDGSVDLYFGQGASICPGTVARDRFDYVNAISNSWKKQMLLNMVKIRYVDAPVFMEVSSIYS